MSDPAWLDDLPLKPGPPWVSMGVRALDLERWLVVDDRFEVELALKQELSARDLDAVFLAREDTVAAGAETLDLVVAWLSRHHPDRVTTPDPTLHPLDAAARLVQEDLCLMVERDGAYRLDAAAVAFASHWRLADKMGAPIATIHAPVHHYADELAGKVDTFMRRLTVERPVVRRNVSIHDHDDLFRPEPPETYEGFTGTIDDLWLRSERQTLVRLPRSGAVLFTIKTQQCPMSAVAAHPALATGLARKLRALRTELDRLGLPSHAPAALPDWLDPP